MIRPLNPRIVRPALRAAQPNAGRILYPESFGAAPDGQADSSQAFLEAFAAMNASPNSALVLSPGVYICNAPLMLTVPGTIRGEGWRQTTIMCRDNLALPQAQLAVQAQDFRLSGFALWNQTPAVGDGIVCSQLTDNPVIEDVMVFQAYRGIVLGPTVFGSLRNSQVVQSVNDGIAMQGNAQSNCMQWEIDGVSSSQNGGHGFRMTAAPGGGPGAMGGWRRPYTYNNGGDGIHIEAPDDANVLGGLQLWEGVSSNDCGDGIYLNPHAGTIDIAHWYIEQAGNPVPGSLRQLAPRAGFHSGVHLTPRGNWWVTISNVRVQFSSGSGFLIESSFWGEMVACHAWHNGRYGYEFTQEYPQVGLTGCRSNDDELGKLSGNPMSKWGGNL
jgi:hypothetical protein